MSDNNFIRVRISTDSIRLKKDRSDIRHPLYTIARAYRINHYPFLSNRIILIKGEIFCFAVKIFLIGCKFINDNINSTAFPIVVFVTGIKNAFVSTDSKPDNIRIKITTKRNDGKRKTRGVPISINWTDIAFCA